MGLLTECKDDETGALLTFFLIGLFVAMQYYVMRRWLERNETILTNQCECSAKMPSVTFQRQMPEKKNEKEKLFANF